MNTLDNEQDSGNYIFLAGIIQEGGPVALKKWFQDQPTWRQTHVLELLENLSKDFNKLHESLQVKTATIHKFPTKFRVITGKKG